MTKEKKSTYRIIRSKRRTLAINIEQGKVIVRSPKTLSQNAIEQFIVEKERWINRAVIEQKQQIKNIYRIEDGAILPVLGENIAVSLSTKNKKTGRTVKRPSIVCKNHVLRIQLLETDQQNKMQAQITRLFMRWIKSIAAAHMTPKTESFAAKLGLSQDLTEVHYRRTRSKWGHCTANGKIQYNPLIALAPLSVIDYLIAHEVCHLRHRNHSQRFQALLATHCSEWKNAEKWLKEQGYKLDIMTTAE